MHDTPDFARDFLDAIEERHFHVLIWRGLPVEIEYRPYWLGSRARGDDDVAHVQITSPDRSPLPITETGYRSHFTSRAEVEDAGGPIAFVAALLDEGAQSPKWLRYVEQSRQGTLFG